MIAIPGSKMWIPALLCLLATNVNAWSKVAQLIARDYAQPGCKVSKLCDENIPVTNAQANIPSAPNAATEASAARDNCGFGGCITFDAADQYVSTTGDYAFQSPGESDIRGPCPGLNAAANHGYISRDGIVGITDLAQGLYQLYGMGLDVGVFLAAYAIAFDGDVLTQQWSIGGPMPPDLLSGLLGTPQGISYSHNKYEGDTSITRCDAYINDGDAHSSSTTRFAYAFASGMEDDSYTLDKFGQLFAKNTIRSIASNPLYFAPLFSTTVVSPVAYNFVVAFMSNHTAEQPGGYLNGDIFKSFFAIEGEYPHFTWNRGQERIPDNWYRRPSLNLYDSLNVVADLAIEFAAYPSTFRFGGNTNGVNTYTGIDIANFTSGAYNVDTLFQGNNLACFIVQNMQQALPEELNGGINDVGKAIALIQANLPSAWTSLNCPTIDKYDSTVFSQYTGAKYTPLAPKGGVENC